MNCKRLLLAVVLLAAACGKQEDGPPSTLPEAEITLTKTEVTLDYKSDAQGLLKVTASLNWTAESSDSWLTLSPTSGTADKSVTLRLKAAANPQQEPRIATVTVRSGRSSATIAVTQKAAPEILTPEQVPDHARIYIPQQYRSHAFLQSDQEWFFGRSIQSDHFILFWSSEYGDQRPDAGGNLTGNSSYASGGKVKVNLNEVLSFLEDCFKTYTGKLGFADIGEGKSYLDEYKMMIFLNNQKAWKAEGWGYDATVGAFWVNPDACADHFVVAHEIGHSFQYQVYCDLVHNGAPDNGLRAWQPAAQTGNGCTFWEQTSQWQASVMVPEQTFTEWQFTDKSAGFAANAHRHILHEDMRYASYLIQRAWTTRYGMDAVGRVWRSAKSPDDALQAYQHLFGLDLEELNAHLYDYAARVATMDFDDTRDEGYRHLDIVKWQKTRQGDGYVVNKARVPEATGFNIIKLNNFTEGENVVLHLEGRPNADGYNKCDASKAGWTVGFVGLDADNQTRYYSDTAIATNGTELKASVSFAVPAGCKRLWAVVSATPTAYIGHVWDGNNNNDPEWPYYIEFEGANP